MEYYYFTLVNFFPTRTIVCLTWKFTKFRGVVKVQWHRLRTAHYILYSHLHGLFFFLRVCIMYPQLCTQLFNSIICRFTQSPTFSRIIQFLHYNRHSCSSWLCVSMACEHLPLLLSTLKSRHNSIIKFLHLSDSDCNLPFSVFIGLNDFYIQL